MGSMFDMHTNKDVIEAFYNYITHRSPENVDDVLDFVSDLTDMSQDRILQEIDKINELEMG